MSRAASTPARLAFASFALAAFGVMAAVFSREQLARTGGAWSAPLDDAFIHAAFARSAALGRPLHWIPTDGVSSGGTSVLWPLLLAVPWALGARGASIVLAGRALAVLLTALGFAALERPLRRVHPLAPWASVLRVAADGPVLWHLFSGMELALVFAALAALVRAAADHDEERSDRSLGKLGGAGAFAVLARPEAFALVAIAALLAAASPPRVGMRAARTHATTPWRTLLVAAVPAAVTLAALACVYRATTGSFGASGATAKLLHTHPLLTAPEVTEKLLANVVFVFRRVLGRDLGVGPLAPPLDPHLSVGALAFAVALLPAAHRYASAALAFGLFVVTWGPSRVFASDAAQAFWGSVFLVPLTLHVARRGFDPDGTPGALVLLGAAWGLVSATNGAVIYHLDRYLMPMRALWLVAAASGLVRLVALWRRHPLSSAAGLGVVAWALGTHTEAHRGWRDHFAHACENIHEQHVQTARFLRELEPKPARVLLNDAGVIPYVSELPALDLVGLGGYARLPWAAANRFGVGASLELVERLPADERPTHLAVYPLWFPGLTEHFGRELRRFPVRENYICGGVEKVVYEARWDALHRGDAPTDPRDARDVVLDVDLGDLVSEAEHAVTTSRPLPRDFRVLHAGTFGALFDGGALLGGGDLLAFDLGSTGATHVALRLATLERGTIRFAADGAPLDERQFEASMFWNELVVPLPAGARRFTVALTSGRTLAAHAWALSRPTAARR
jgi:hypothetical protein